MYSLCAGSKRDRRIRSEMYCVGKKVSMIGCGDRFVRRGSIVIMSYRERRFSLDASSARASDVCACVMLKSERLSSRGLM